MYQARTDRNHKKDSWQSVASEFAITPEEAYKKFRSLRTYVKNEQKKLHKNSGSGGGKIVKWFAYDTISFILSRDISESGMDTGNTINYVCLKTVASTMSVFFLLFLFI